MNSVNLMGRICNDLELKTAQSGTSYINFSIVVDRFSNSSKTTDFIRCVAWRKCAENISKYFHKGDLIAVTGNLKTGNYTDRTGVKHYTTDVNIVGFDFTGAKSDRSDTRNNNYQQRYSPNYHGGNASTSEYYYDDDKYSRYNNY